MMCGGNTDISLFGVAGLLEMIRRFTTRCASGSSPSENDPVQSVLIVSMQLTAESPPISALGR